MPHAAILFYVMLPGVGPAEQATLLDEVRAAIEEAAAQTFHGTIEYHQESVHPPRPELLDDLAFFDPDNAPVSGDEEADAKMRDFYRRVHEAMRHRALNRHSHVYDLAVTIGPEQAICLDRYYRPDEPPRTTVWRASRIWEYQLGRGILLTCDGDREHEGTIQAAPLRIDIGEARYVARFFVNQFFGREGPEAVESVRMAGENSILARMTNGRQVEFASVKGRLRTRRITRSDGARVWQFSFGEYMRVGDNWIPRWVEVVDHPAGEHTLEQVRRVTRTITAIRPLDESELELQFARPDPSDPAYGQLMYEQDVSEPDAPLVPLREGLQVIETTGVGKR